MIIPCIDLIDGKVVQLVQGRDKAMEVDSPLATIEQFKVFPEIQVIDLDAAMAKGANDALIEFIASQVVIRAGGGVRTVARACQLVEQGAYHVIVGTAAFNRPLLESIATSIGKERLIIALDSRGGKVVVQGWREATECTALNEIRELRHLGIHAALGMALYTGRLDLGDLVRMQGLDRGTA